VFDFRELRRQDRRGRIGSCLRLRRPMREMPVHKKTQSPARGGFVAELVGPGSLRRVIRELSSPPWHCRVNCTSARYSTHHISHRIPTTQLLSANIPSAHKKPQHSFPTVIYQPPPPPSLLLLRHHQQTMFTLPTLRLNIRITLPKLHLGRILRRGLIRVILAALFIARAEIRAINVQGMLLSWFRFCPEFRDQAQAQKGGEWGTQRGEARAC